MNISLFPTKAVVLFLATALVLLLSPLSSISQSIELNLINQYSQYTETNAFEPIAPNARATFLNEDLDIYFNLIFNKGGLSTRSVIGKIEDNQMILMDTIDVLGFPDRLVGYYTDSQMNIYYSNQSFIGTTTRKMSWEGELLWEHFDTTSALYTPWYFFEESEGNPMIPARKKWIDTTYSYTLTKLDKLTGEVIWESEIMEKGSEFYSVVKAKEYEDHFKVFFYNGQKINLAKVSLDGELITLASKSNPLNEDIFKHIFMDDEGFTYLGLNAWGYRVPKLDEQLDTVWMFEKPSMLEEENGNRMNLFEMDQNGNLYLAGEYKRSELETTSFQVTKLNPDGNAVWEFHIGDILPDTLGSFSTDLKIINDQLWITGLVYDSSNEFYGMIWTIDTTGILTYSRSIPELEDRVFPVSFEIQSNNLLLTASTGSYPDSIFQHILHYRIDSVSTTTNFPGQILVKPYPNPTSDYISIKDVRLNELSNVQLFDLNGKLMAIDPKVISGNYFDLTALPAGIYFLNYTIDGKQHGAKIVKQ